GYESPLDLHHAELRLRMDVTNVGAERDLESSAKGDAMDGSEHRNRNLAPDPRHPLREIRRTGASIGEELGRCLGRRHERLEVETGAERLSLAGKNDRPYLGFVGERLAGGDQGL